MVGRSLNLIPSTASPFAQTVFATGHDFNKGHPRVTVQTSESTLCSNTRGGADCGSCSIADILLVACKFIPCQWAHRYVGSSSYLYRKLIMLKTSERELYRALSNLRARMMYEMLRQQEVRCLFNWFSSEKRTEPGDFLWPRSSICSKESRIEIWFLWQLHSAWELREWNLQPHSSRVLCYVLMN